MIDPPPDSSLPRPRLIYPPEQADFVRLEHARSLKGLLRPFKGKGELQIWASECEAIRDGLIVMSQRLLAQATAYPFSLLPVTLAQQATGAGTTFLRWRNADRSAMGVAQWAKLIEQPTTPISLVHELLSVEMQRITLNMQVSLTHTIARQALECVEKMAQAESVYHRRVDGHSRNIPQESP